MCIGDNFSPNQNVLIAALQLYVFGVEDDDMMTHPC